MDSLENKQSISITSLEVFTSTKDNIYDDLSDKEREKIGLVVIDLVNYTTKIQDSLKEIHFVNIQA